MSYDYLLGIDPGLSGALALVTREGVLIDVWDMPVTPNTKGGNQVCSYNLGAIMRGEVGGVMNSMARMPSEADIMVCIELVNGMPSIPGKDGKRRRIGSTSGFGFGKSCGKLEGVMGALDVPMQFITPAKWKKWAGLTGKDKDYARTVAIQKCPSAARILSRKKDIGRADALLIALYHSLT